MSFCTKLAPWRNYFRLVSILILSLPVGPINESTFVFYCHFLCSCRLTVCCLPIRFPVYHFVDDSWQGNKNSFNVWQLDWKSYRLQLHSVNLQISYSHNDSIRLRCYLAQQQRGKFPRMNFMYGMKSSLIIWKWKEQPMAISLCGNRIRSCNGFSSYSCSRRLW